LAESLLNLGTFSRDQQHDKNRAKQYFQQAETLWVALVRDAPQVVAFQRFLAQVRGILSEL